MDEERALVGFAALSECFFFAIMTCVANGAYSRTLHAELKP